MLSGLPLELPTGMEQMIPALTQFVTGIGSTIWHDAVTDEEYSQKGKN
jgi:hypothetical protein